MIILAIDTAASLCAASIHDTVRGELGRSVHDLGKGHAEHLIGTVEDALGAAGKAYPDIDAIAVSVGPGSFTGVRVGVAAARGLALALERPAIGISTLEAIAADALDGHPGKTVLAAIGAGRGQVYAALFGADGTCLDGPAVIAQGALPSWAIRAAVVAGSAAPLLPDEVAIRFAEMSATADIGRYASLASTRLSSGAAFDKPVPLYLRAADAKVQQGYALPRKGADA